MPELRNVHDLYHIIGAVVEILLDVRQLNRGIVNLNRMHVSVQDILKELNARLSTVRVLTNNSSLIDHLILLQVECTLHGHVSMDGTPVVIAVPTQSPRSPMMVSGDGIMVTPRLITLLVLFIL